MTDSAAAINQILSDRHFFRKSLLTATLAAAASSVLLIGIFLCIGGIAKLVTQSNALSGLVNVGTSAATYPMKQISSLVALLPPLHQSGSGLTFCFVLLGTLIVVRALLRTHVERRIDYQVARAVNRRREHLHRHALRSNPGDLTGSERDEAAQLFQQTAQQLEDAARRWGVLRLTSACDLLVLLVVLLSTQWRVGVECIVPILICWYIARVEANRHETSAHLLTEQVERGLQRLTEDLNKARIVAGYGMEKQERVQFSRGLQTYLDRCNDLHHQQQQVRWSSLFVTMAAIALPGFILARHLLFGTLISLPSAVVLAASLGMIYVVLRQLQDVPNVYGVATVAADDISQHLRRIPSVSQIVDARFLEPMSRLLQFDQVAVETDDRPGLLSCLDLKIEFGQRLALLSLDPLEAEALVSLIPRFRDPSSGQVLIDGTDIRQVTLESLRAEAVIVGGDEQPFNATVLENITVGQAKMSRQDAMEASKLVHAESFIRQLPKGYETHLGEYLLPEAGQRFRLSLARAVARKPALLVVQEPAGTLDTETKAMLDDTYDRICTSRTVIFLPTRLSTVKKCDRIVMIHEGQVVEDGRHEDLVRTSELYRHWEYMRFNVYRTD